MSQQKQRDGRSFQFVHVCSFTPSYRFSWRCVCVCAACWGLSQRFVCPAECVCCLSLKQPCREKQSVCHRALCGGAEFTLLLPPRLAPSASRLYLSVFVFVCLSRAASSITEQTATLSPSVFQAFSWCRRAEAAQIFRSRDSSSAAATKFPDYILASCVSVNGNVTTSRFSFSIQCCVYGLDT